ncbi:MAG: hypothetical protein ACXVB4_06580 [Pseudobdellovibrionaceae bacterium]
MSFLNIIYAALLSLLVMYCFWSAFDPRVLVIFAVALGFTETFIQIRWRLSVPCKQCGFDPVLYLKDADKAADKVTEHLKQRRLNPKYLLAKPLNLPSLSAAKAEALQSQRQANSSEKDKKGILVSRQA